MRLMNICMGLFCFVLSSTNASAQEFEFLKATSQAWVAGVRGGGRGINYEIHLLAIKSSKKVKFDSLSVKERGVFPLHVTVSTKGGKYLGVTKTPVFEPGDTIKLKASYYTKTDYLPKNETEKASSDSSTILVPMNYSGAGLIYYRGGKKKKSKEIESFNKLPQLNYP